LRVSGNHKAETPSIVRYGEFYNPADLSQGKNDGYLSKSAIGTVHRYEVKAGAAMPEPSTEAGDLACAIRV